MLRIASQTLSTTLAILGLAACADSPPRPDLFAPAALTASASAPENGKHLVVFTGDTAPADFEARVSARGGSVERVFAGAGLAVLRGLTDAAALDLASTRGIDAVERDMTIGPDSPDEPVDVDAVEAASPSAAAEATADASTTNPSSPAKYYARQWNLRAIGANLAWGMEGAAEVRVFILDTGIDYDHPDLKGRVDLSPEGGSVSLLSHLEKPGDEDMLTGFSAGDPHLVMDFHSHGTSVASVIVSNDRLVAGVTKKTKIVSVKVHDRRRTGDISVYVEGIIYAATHGADVIHLSIPAQFDKHEHPGAVAAINAATGYAHRKGAVLVAAAGNAIPPTNFDRDQDGFKFCNAAHVICVSATAPTSASFAPDGLVEPVNVDEWAPYSFYGRSTISVAGPGGGPFMTRTALTAVPLACSRRSQTVLDGRSRCSTNVQVNPIGKEDPVWYSTGTSFGAAATSGLAALLVSRLGHGQPERIRDTIETSADDLGDPGRDAKFGWGGINVVRAIGLLNQPQP